MSMLLGSLRSTLDDVGFVPSDVPWTDANALIQFYLATGGPTWTVSTNWLVDPVVDNWLGVTVAGGRVTQLALPTNNLAGPAGTTLAPLADSLIFLNGAANALTSLDASMMGALTALYWQDNNTPTLDLSGLANGVTIIRCDNNGMLQPAVNSAINDVWTRRADWSDATPDLYVGGTNATPTGIYQDGYPLPLTALEEVHDLFVDDDAGGFQTWASIVWNGGSTP